MAWLMKRKIRGRFWQAPSHNAVIRRALRFLILPASFGLIIGLTVALSDQGVRYQIGDQFAQWFLRPVESKQSYAQAVSAAANAVVNISTRTVVDLPRNPLFDDPLFRSLFQIEEMPVQRRMSTALGSGVIINTQGYILTNHHVIKGAQEIIVSFYDGRHLQATIVGSDVESDLAVLKIPGRDDMPTIPLGNPDEARVGDVVLAIGNPFNIGQTVTQGIISATGRHGLGVSVYENFIQTDAAINPGNSGGALVNTEGELLGINTAILNQNNDGTSIGIGFAIPADIALRITSDIVNAGEAIRGWLGIVAEALTEDTINQFRLTAREGVIVTAIYPDGPADQVGIQAGDVLTHINDQLIQSTREGMNLMAQIRPQERVDLTIQRGNQIIELVAVAIKRPSALIEPS